MLFNLRVLFIKMYISYVATLFLPTTYRVNFFIGTSNLINAFDETFFSSFQSLLLSLRMCLFFCSIAAIVKKTNTLNRVMQVIDPVYP